MDIQNSIAVVTGGGSGLGEATAQMLSDKGAKVAILDLGKSRGAAFAEELGGNAIFVEADVTNDDQLAAAIAQAAETFGAIHVTVNCAGIATAGKTLGKGSLPLDLGPFRKTIEVNLIGTFNVIRLVAAHMARNTPGDDGERGVIINTASVAGIRSGAGGNAYSASKAGVINFTMTAACDLGQFNIRVNAVCPGLIETGMTAPVFKYARENNKEEKLGTRCELRRYGRPEEIAGAIAFLASDDASYVTGQALAVDGGNTASLNLPGMKF